MAMTKRKVKIVQHKHLPGDLAYYLNGEIHILNPEAMYRKVLRHEMSHAREGLLFKLSETMNDVFSNPLSRAIMFFTLLGVFAYEIIGASVLLLHINPVITGLTTVVSIATLLFSSRAFYWLEEWKAGHESETPKRKARQKPKPDTVQNSPVLLTNPVNRIPTATPTPEPPLEASTPDSELEMLRDGDQE